ncbi:hypothetical protein [Acetobacterium sp.]|uniref:hypothetical protein n=1 Tax=Acetobacterium sp. TaxID=1872094 RepID=UPI000CBBFD39|nr:hypothetical protein [Acetobacterium sp.]MDO9490993.1 hypothetical protein [Acetobacterium sp.]PKM71200.1 MAG: hypothetical protein CVU92_09685 [Firmicutes bacterium HGW-Firmicutes-17]
MKIKISKPILIGGVALIGIAVLIGIVLIIFGGAKKEVSTDPLNLYNKVVVGMTKEESEKILEVEGSAKGKGFNYLDENTGYGVTLSYDTVATAAAEGTADTGAEEPAEVVVFKQLYVPDDTYLDGLVNANVTADQINSLKEGMPYEEIKTILGGIDGIEINSAYNKKDPANTYSVMAWINPDRSVAYLTFLGYKGTLKVFEFRPAK